MLGFSADYRFAFIDSRIRRSFAASRLKEFISTHKIVQGAYIADLGGRPEHWDCAPFRLRVDIINSPEEIHRFRDTHRHAFRFVDGDVTKPMSALSAYDYVYCNSVLEHVGDEQARVSLANNVISSGKPYWVQIPSPDFPIEHHCREFFWWRRGDEKRRRKIEEWNETWPFMAEQMRNTVPVTRAEFARLFPQATIKREFLLGFEKSLIATNPERG